MTLYICGSDQSYYFHLVPIAVIDSFKSLIWTKRYYQTGDFELYISADKSLLPYLKKDNFITRDDDDSIMIIDGIRIATDAENGDFFIVTGSSAESVLKRRVFDKPFSISYSGALNQVIQRMLNYFTGDRSLFVLIAPYPRIDNYVIAQFTGVSLFDAIMSVLQPLGISFKLVMNSSINIMQIQLYQGGEVNVEFSPDFDNLINSNYITDYTNFANYAYIAGEGEGDQRRVLGMKNAATEPTGYSRREVYVDARDISSNGGEIPDNEYEEMLNHRGQEKFAEDYSLVESFDAEINPNNPFEYKTDYNLGDIVTITNEYGITSKPRIVEIIESWDETGYNVVPTFENLIESETKMLILRDSNGNILRDSTGKVLRVRE